MSERKKDMTMTREENEVKVKQKGKMAINKVISDVSRKEKGETNEVKTG